MYRVAFVVHKDMSKSSPFTTALGHSPIFFCENSFFINFHNKYGHNYKSFSFMRCYLIYKPSGTRKVNTVIACLLFRFHFIAKFPGIKRNFICLFTGTTIFQRITTAVENCATEVQ